jgi:hypothetical protein
MKFARGLAVLLTVLLAACGTQSDSGVNVYIGGGATAQGSVSTGRTYSFRFVEKWRISHLWLQGAGVNPCLYRGNIFQKISGYPALATDSEGPIFEHGGRVYFAGVLQANPQQVQFWELSYQLLGERISDRRFEGKYTPFCSQPFSSPNGMAIWIVRPDLTKGTDLWIEGSVPTEVNGRTWLVKKVAPVDLGSASDRASPMEYWTLKIPASPYWLHMRFSGSRRSVEQYPAEHAYLLHLFHQIINSVKLDPIAPVDPASMPPFVLYQPQPRRNSSQ